MGKIVLALVALLLLPHLVQAQEESKRHAAAKDAYEKAIADQQAKKERARQEAQAQQKEFRRFEAEQAAIAAENEAMNKALQKECGKDYGQIRVGMKLSRVQKCNGEFYLHGQVQWKGRTVDYYTRGEAFLYIKNGKVVAWGE